MSGRTAKATRRRAIPRAPRGVTTASDLDRAVFEAHPGLDRYIRNRIEGEWGTVESETPASANATIVTQVRPGIRLRRSVTTQGPVGHYQRVIIVTGDTFIRLMGIDPRQVAA